MNRIGRVILVGGILAASMSARAGDTRVGGRMYTDWRMDISDGADDANSFNVTRTYIDVKSKTSDNTSVRFTLDIRQTDAFDGYDIILKYGFLDWTPKFTRGYGKLRFGLHPTPYIDNMNKLWGRRYLEKTAGDLNKLLTTSDLGVSAIVKFGEKGKWGTGSLSLRNGTAYTDVTEMNTQKDLIVYALLKPLAANSNFAKSQFQGQLYTGTLNEEIPTGLNASYYDRSLISLGGVLKYRSVLSAGFDLNSYSSDALSSAMLAPVTVTEVKETAHSFFGTLYLSGLVDETSAFHHLNLFARMDLVDPDTAIPNDGHTLFIAGIENSLSEGVKAAINFRVQSFDNSTTASRKFLYLNWLVKI